MTTTGISTTSLETSSKKDGCQLTKCATFGICCRLIVSAGSEIVAFLVGRRGTHRGLDVASGPVWQSPRTLGIGRALESTTTKAACTLESGCGVLQSTSYPGVAYSRIRPTRVWRTLEYVLPGCGVL